MPVGKDSITKRVAKTEATQESEVKATPNAAEKTATAASKKPAAKKPATAKNTVAKNNTVKSEEKEINSNVLTNIAPETVEKVVGHKEGSDSEKVSIGDEMPFYLM